MRQLIYTSAPKLLDAGKTGFGTLARSKALSELLVSYLERISSFDRQAGVAAVYYYTTYRTGSASYHIFSRVGECGTDYTGRTNHLAHHFVIEQDSAEAAALQQKFSPAGLMLALLPKWRTTYTHDAGYVADEDAPLTPQMKSRVWQQLTNRPDTARWLACAPYNEGCCLSLDVTAQEKQLLQLFDEALGALPHRGWGVAFSTARVSNLSLSNAPFMCIDARQKAAGITPPRGYPVLELNATLSQPPEPAPLSPKPVYTPAPKVPHIEPAADTSALPPPMAPILPLYEPPLPVESPKVIHALNEENHLPSVQPTRHVTMIGIGIILGAFLSHMFGETFSGEKTPPPGPLGQQTETGNAGQPEVKNNGNQPKVDKSEMPTTVDSSPSEKPDASEKSIEIATATDNKQQSSDSLTSASDTTQASSEDSESTDVYTEIDPQNIEKPLVLEGCEIIVEWKEATPTIIVKKTIKLKEHLGKLLEKELYDVYLDVDTKKINIDEEISFEQEFLLPENGQIKEILDNEKRLDKLEKKKKEAEEYHNKNEEELRKSIAASNPPSEKNNAAGNTKANATEKELNDLTTKVKNYFASKDEKVKAQNAYDEAKSKIDKPSKDAKKEAEEEYMQKYGSTARLILKPSVKGVRLELKYEYRLDNERK